MSYGFHFKLPHLTKGTEQVTWIHRPWNSPWTAQQCLCWSNREGDWSTPNKETKCVSKGEAVPPKHCQGALPSHCRCSLYRNPSEIFQRTLSTWPTSSTGQNQIMFIISPLCPKQAGQEHMLTHQHFTGERNCHLWPPLHSSPLDKGFLPSAPESVSTHQTIIMYLECINSVLCTQAPTAEKAVNLVSQIWSLILHTLKTCSIIIPLLVFLFGIHRNPGDSEVPILGQKKMEDTPKCKHKGGASREGHHSVMKVCQPELLHSDWENRSFISLLPLILGFSLLSLCHYNDNQSSPRQPNAFWVCISALLWLISLSDSNPGAEDIQVPQACCIFYPCHIPNYNHGCG